MGRPGLETGERGGLGALRVRLKVFSAEAELPVVDSLSGDKVRTWGRNCGAVDVGAGIWKIIGLRSVNLGRWGFVRKDLMKPWYSWWTSLKVVVLIHTGVGDLVGILSIHMVATCLL